MSISSTIQNSYLLKEKDYWQTKLKGEIPQVGLPLDFQEKGRSATEQVVEFTLDPDVIERVTKASRGNDSLLFAILVGALKLCLNKYTGLEDIVVGSAIHERHKNSAFSNHVLLLRDRIEASMTIRQILDGVRQTLAEAYANQRYPVERLHETSSGDRNQQPLFRVAIVLEPIHDLKNIADQGQDMTLKFSGADKNHSAEIFFNPARLRTQTCEQFASHYRQVLREMLTYPDRSIAEIQLFSEEQKRELLQKRNASRRKYPREATIPELFEEQAKLRPEAVAVRYEGRSLTYRELNSAANRLASCLRKKGAGLETPVGICMERSLEMIIGVLGILKSGAAYVPFEPEYPLERQQTIIRDSGVRLIIVCDERTERFSSGIELVHLSQERGEWSLEPDDNLENKVNAGNLAYIMYTSGSTGIPKGVAVPHRGVVRLVKEANYVEFGDRKTILQFAPLSFDASTFEIWGSLLNGGELVVMSAGKPSLEALGAMIRKNKINTLWLTAGLFQLMVDHRLEDLKGINQLVVGGDVVPVAQAQKFRNATPGGTLIDGYGPTENTTFTCCHRMVPETEIGNSVPIGMPISNTEVHIVDRNFDLVPTGVVGELYAGGDGLARGYVNASELTAEKFVPNPFSETEGERLYRTGDLARYRWDGAIEFVGRADQQVKVRGFRIEPVEIESVLGRHENVRASVVVVEERNGEKDLIAYVVACEDLTKRELRKYLEEKLPHYMIPSTLVKIKEMPLTTNGKVDRVRLAELKAASQDNEGEESYVAPRNEMEEVIAGIWKEALGLERVGIFDNFFDLGGHSLLAMKICTKMSGKLLCEARVTDLFRNPTVESLARHLGEKSRPAVIARAL